MNKCKLNSYDYQLPAELIAQEPLKQRDQSRMLILYRQTGHIEHTTFDHFPDYLEEGDLLVLNDTKVIPARLIGQIAGKTATAELLLLNSLDNGNWVAMVKPGRKLKQGAKVIFEHGMEAVIEGYTREGLREISFRGSRPIEEVLTHLGKVPLPPYIHQDVEDPDQYQTIYAREEGSAAAPTAGFHFTDQVFENLKKKGIETTFVTLHIGPGTFQPVKTEDIREHVMHSEYYRLDQQTAHRLNLAQKENRRIIAVGTTVCRVLETCADENGLFRGDQESWSDLFIYPGFNFRAVGALLTNFHLPQSTLLMLVSALGGYDQIMAAYRQAVEMEYRFYSFGDCMLII